MKVLEERSQPFLQKMNSKAITAKLQGLDLIPDRVNNDIQHSRSREDANQCLLTFLKEDATEKQVHDVFTSVSEEKTFGRICTFAANSLHQLQRGLCMPNRCINHWVDHSLHSLLTSDDVYKICQCKYFSVSKLLQYAKSLSLAIVLLAHSHSTGVAKV